MANNPTEMGSSLLPFISIEAATASCDADAIDVVLKHYKRYIVALTKMTLYDENGKLHLCVDEEMKRRLETKLITKILCFNLQKVA